MPTTLKVISVLASATLVAGHGFISSIVANGKKYLLPPQSTNKANKPASYTGYLVNQYPYQDNPPESIGWSTSATDLGFVDGTKYQSPDIICHRDAKPGQLSAEVTAGSNMTLQWTTWPDSHHGPLITYLASCNGACSSVDKTTLKFFKFDARGLIDDSNPPGVWATDDLISDGKKWTVAIPGDIANGEYVLRNEIIALHSAAQKDGAQNYPQCLNLKVTGSGGSAVPDGTAGEKLYKDTDPGILVDIYSPIDEYVMPGPAMYNA